MGIVRQAHATSDKLRAAVKKSAEEHGYREIAPDVFQKTIMRQRDPLLGLVPIEGEPQMALAFRASYQTNETGTLISVAPVLQLKHLTDGGYRERSLLSNSPDRGELVDMIDRITSELEYSKN